jgi:hypothetical protein
MCRILLKSQIKVCISLIVIKGSACGQTLFVCVELHKIAR